MTEPIDPNALPLQPAAAEQPYLPPPPFAPPAPASQPHSGWPTPHPGWPPQPSAGYPPFGPWEQVAPPAPRRTSAWVWALAAAGVIALVIGLASVVSHERRLNDARGTEGRTLVLPTAVDDYRKVQTLDVQQLLDEMGTSLTGLGIGTGQLDSVKGALYARSGAPEPTFVFLGMLVADIPQLQREIDSRGVAATVRDFTSGIALGGSAGGGAVTGNIQSVEPGPLGGSMRCGQLSVLTRDVSICGWGDRSAFAACLLIDPNSLDGTAGLVRDFRAAAEH